MNAKALVVPLLALVGLAGYFVLRSGSEPDPAPIPAQHGSGEGGARPAGAADLASGTINPATAPGAATAGSNERLEAPGGVGGAASESVSVRGRLVDRQGAPRAGVVMAMQTWAGLDEIELDGLPPFPAGGRDRDRDDLPTCTTRADGTFQIQLAKNRSGQLELRAADLVFAKNEPTVQGKKGDQDLGDITVLRAASVQGLVQDERGLPVAGVKVAMVYGAFGFGTESSSTTKADGAFTLGKLRAGKWSLRTASGKFLPTVAEVEIAAEEQRTGVVLVVKPGRAIAGQVVDDRGVGVAAMKVGSKRKEARGAVDIERFSPDEATTTDQHGYFTLSGLAEATASVRAFGPGHSSASAADVPVGTGDLVLRVERLGSVEGVLVGADGTPIAGSRVRAAAAGGLGDGLMISDDLVLDGPQGNEGTVTAADGTFKLASVRPGTVTVSAQGETHRPARQAGVNVVPAQVTKGVRLVADRGASARLKVVDDAGKPVAGAVVKAQRAENQVTPMGGATFQARAISVEEHDGEMVIGSGNRLASATSDEQGIATLHGLPAGELSFGATHTDFAPATPVRLTLPKAGTVESSLTMRKPGLAEITVRGTDGAPQAGVDVKIEGDGEGAAEPKRLVSDANGLVRATGLAPGAYRALLTRVRGGSQIGTAVFVLGDGDDAIASSAQPFTVLAGQTTQVELRRPILTKVHGLVTGADGPVRGCVVELSGEDSPGLDLPGFGGRNATTNADGVYEFADVEAGAYTLQFGKPDQVVKARQEFTVPPNTPELRLDLALRTGTLRVQVVAQGSGEAVEKAEVEIARATGPAVAGAPPRQERRVMVMATLRGDAGGDGAETTSMTIGQQRAHTDEDGVAVIEDVPVGDYTVRIKHRKHSPLELQGKAVVERQVTDLGRIELGAAGQIRGKIVGADGKPPRMALVSSRPAERQDWSEPTMAQSGNYRLQGLAAGRYMVRAQSLGQAESGYSPEVEVEVKPGETATADLQLPAK